MTGNAKQDSGNGTFHGIPALNQINFYKKQAPRRLVNYRVGVRSKSLIIKDFLTNQDLVAL